MEHAKGKWTRLEVKITKVDGPKRLTSADPYKCPTSRIIKSIIRKSKDVFHIKSAEAMTCSKKRVLIH